MKQTAIDWLIYEINKLTGLNICKDEPIIEQAKEMEKEQIEDAYNADRPNIEYFELGEAFEEYYNETYEKKEDW